MVGSHVTLPYVVSGHYRMRSLLDLLHMVEEYC